MHSFNSYTELVKYDSTFAFSVSAKLLEIFLDVLLERLPIATSLVKPRKLLVGLDYDVLSFVLGGSKILVLYGSRGLEASKLLISCCYSPVNRDEVQEDTLPLIIHGVGNIPVIVYSACIRDELVNWPKTKIKITYSWSLLYRSEETETGEFEVAKITRLLTDANTVIEVLKEFVKACVYHKKISEALW